MIRSHRRKRLFPWERCERPQHAVSEIFGYLFLFLRRTSLEINHKTHDVRLAPIFLAQLKLTSLLFYQVIKKSQAGGGVAVKIEHAVYQSAKMYGRHFDDKDEVYSHITRQSIDVLKVR